MPYNRYPRERIRAVILEMLASGTSPGQLNPTQVRLRLGGGTWSIIQEEIAAILAGGPKGKAETADEADASLERLVPDELVALAARVDDALSAVRTAVRELVSAVLVREAQRHETEVSALRLEVERLRAGTAGSDRESPPMAQPGSSGVVKGTRRPRR